jgi:tetratricopeptide (TPR) repeat protein
VDVLKTNSSDAFRIALQYYDSEEHVSVALISLYDGLRFIFEGYKAPPTVIENPTLADAHFAKMSKRMGYPVLPPEEFASTWGEGALYWQRATNKAIEWFDLNTKNYPDSFINYDSLGYVYAQSGNKDLAIKNYQKALELNPDHRRAAEQLRRLKGFTDDGPFTNGVYKLVNKKSGQALEVGGASETNSASIVPARYGGKSHQQWNLTAQGDGYYQITAAHTRKALAIASDNATEPGAKLVQRPVHGRANQIWRVVANGDGTYRLLNEHSGLALRANGSTVDQWSWEDSPQQKWRIQPVAETGK